MAFYHPYDEPLGSAALRTASSGSAALRTDPDSSAALRTDPDSSAALRTVHFRATQHTQGPWAEDAQHGGPPAALLAHHLEQALPPRHGRIARVTVEILGPIPVGDLSIHTTLTRPGRSVAMAVAELHADGRVAARAHGWWIRGTELDAEARAAVDVPTPPPPRPAEPGDVTSWPGGFLRAMDWRFVQGSFDARGAATAWARPRFPLLPAVDFSPLARTMIVADCGNGLSGRLDPARYWFINPELTVHLHRQPVGDWVCIRARTTIAADGIGLAESVLSDNNGPVGRGAQALMIGPR